MGTGIRRAAATAMCTMTLAWGVMACSAPEPAPPAPPRAGPPTTSQVDGDVMLCRAYADASPSAHAPVNAMRQEAVLAPFVDYIELGTHEVAARGRAARDPAIAAALREVVAAQDDLDAQGRRALPAGADATRTTVRLDPGRLDAALAAADRTCAPLLTR